MKEFTKKHRITSYEVDTNRRLKPSAILKIVQQLGEEHMQAVDYSFAKLFDMEIVFILTKCRVKIIKNAYFMDNIFVKTWCANPLGVHYNRFYEFYSEENELLIICTTSSVPVNPQSRKILRSVNILSDVLFDDLPSILDVESLSSSKGELLQTHDRTIKYSDLDYNNHLNNTVYSDFLVDYFPHNIYKYEVNDFTIYFKNECIFNDLLKIYVHKSNEESAIYYEGKVEEKIKFLAKMQFKNK